MYKVFFKYKITSIFFLVTILFASDACQGLMTAVRFKSHAGCPVTEIYKNRNFLKELEGSMLDTFDESNFQFNQHNKNILFNHVKGISTSYGNDSLLFEVWNISDPDCPGSLRYVKKGSLVFSSKYMNSIAYIFKGVKSETVHVYDTFKREVIREIPCSRSCLGIHFSKKDPDYLIIVEEGGYIQYYNIKEGELDEKRSVRLNLGRSFYRCVFNDYDEDIIFFKSLLEVRIFNKGENRWKIVDERGVHSSQIKVIDEQEVAIERLFRNGKKEVLIFDPLTMEETRTFEVLKNEKFLGRFVVYFYENKISIEDIVTGEIKNISIPSYYFFDEKSKFKIRKKHEQDSFVFALLVKDKDTEQEEILFYDLDAEKLFCQIKDEDNRTFLDFDFYVDPEVEDPDLEDKIGFLIKYLNELKFDELEPEEIQLGTKECEFGQKIFRDSIITLDVFGTDSFPVYKSMCL